MAFGTVLKAYSARDYTHRHPRTTKYVEVNLPDILPTVPKDNHSSTMSIQGGYTANTNYPIGKRTITISHCLKLPLLSGTSCPVVFKKGTPFLLFTPTGKAEEGYLLFI